MDNDPEQPTPPTSVLLPPAARILRLKDVCKVTDLGRSYIYQLQAEGRFPHSIKIGVRVVGWLEGEVQEWLKTRVLISRSNS
jgi:prophage regulatory protein